MNTNGLAKFAKKIINEYRQAGDVIHMRMGNNHIADGALLGITKRNANAAGIDSYAIVDDKAGQTLRGTGAAV